MKKKENDTFLIFLVVILIIIALILVIFRVINGKSLETNDKLVTELHDYFSSDNLSNCEGLLNYNDGVVESKNTRSDLKLCFAFQKTALEPEKEITYKSSKKDDLCVEDEMTFRTEEGSNLCKVRIYSKEEVEKTYTKMYGENVGKEVTSFKLDGFNICFVKDDKYYCGLSDEITYTVGSDIAIYRSIKKASERGDTIFIYDYFIKLVEEKCYTAYDEGEESIRCSKAYSKLKDKKMDYDFIKNYGTLYKHTFKKNQDNTYYWVKSERV